MFSISRCHALKRPLRLSTKPLPQSLIRPLSQSSILSLRPTPRLRQEEQPAPTLKGPLEYSDSFYERVGKPRIRNQVIVSRVALLFPLQLCISEQVLGSS